MRIHPGRIAAAVVLVGLLAGALAQAQAPTTMVYQGRLLTAAGVPVTTATSVIFRVWTAASGGSQLWTETRSVTPDVNGIFTIELGTTTALTTTVFDGTVRYLGIQIASEAAEMTPRQVLSSTPYALRATTASTVPAPASVEGVANNGGNIDIVPGTGLTVTGSDASNNITIATTTGGMHPIAYGYINTAGTVVSGSGNLTCTYDAGTYLYTITMTGVTLDLNHHLVTLTNLGYSMPHILGVSSSSGNLLVRAYTYDGSMSTAYFQIAIYALPNMKSMGQAPDGALNPEPVQR